LITLKQTANFVILIGILIILIISISIEKPISCRLNCSFANKTTKGGYWLMYVLDLFTLRP
jgi:hypothetical protein